LIGSTDASASTRKHSQFRLSSISPLANYRSVISWINLCRFSGLRLADLILVDREAVRFLCRCEGQDACASAGIHRPRGRNDRQITTDAVVKAS
jgi:hypothetical protein